MKWIIRVSAAFMGPRPMYFECIVYPSGYPMPPYPRLTYHINKAKIFDNKTLAKKQFRTILNAKIVRLDKELAEMALNT